MARGILASRRVKLLLPSTMLAWALLGTLPVEAAIITTAEARIWVDAARSLRVRVVGVVVVKKTMMTSLDIRISASGDVAASTLATDAFTAGENDCSVADDVTAGTINRRITVDPAGASMIQLFIGIRGIRYNTKVDGSLQNNEIEPLGPPPGTTISGPYPIEIGICVT